MEVAILRAPWAGVVLAPVYPALLPFLLWGAWKDSELPVPAGVLHAVVRLLGRSTSIRWRVRPTDVYVTHHPKLMAHCCRYVMAVLQGVGTKSSQLHVAL